MAAYKIRLNKGDTVVVRAGKYKGKTGKVLATHPRTNMVTVEGLNLVTRHQKPTQTNPQAGSHEITRPFPVSKVSYFDPSSKKATRIGYKISKGGDKSRVAKLSGRELK